MTLQLLWQIVLGVFAVVGFFGSLTALYSWFQQRNRLKATVRYCTYRTDPSDITRMFRDAVSLAFQGTSNARTRLGGFAERTVEGGPGLGPEPKAYFEVRITNLGSTTLESVRLTASDVGTVRIVRQTGKSELFLELSGRDQLVELGTLGPAEELTVHAWGPSTKSAGTFRLVHSRGHGKIRVLVPRRSG